MPETPPPFSPTASHEDTDQGQELDQAKPARTDSTSTASTPPLGTAGFPSTPAGSSTQPASDASPQNTQQQAPTQPQPLQAASSGQDAQKEAGHVPNASQAAPRREPVTVGIRTVRGPGGRFEPLNPVEPPKAQSAALLKPVVPTTYDESPTPKGGIDGLSLIPKGWPDLPSNVSLSVEIAWVQSERLRVVKEKPAGGCKVDLSKARVPAPSMAALSWLETSIRSYAKFVEVAAKQASSGQDEAEFVRKERMQIGEIRSILSEMMVDKAG